MKQRILLGKLADSTWSRYQQTLRGFKVFLQENGAVDLPSMNRAGCAFNFDGAFLCVRDGA